MCVCVCEKFEKKMAPTEENEDPNVRLQVQALVSWVLFEGALLSIVAGT